MLIREQGIIYLRQGAHSFGSFKHNSKMSFTFYSRRTPWGPEKTFPLLWRGGHHLLPWDDDLWHQHKMTRVVVKTAISLSAHVKAICFELALGIGKDSTSLVKFQCQTRQTMTPCNRLYIERLLLAIAPPSVSAGNWARFGWIDDFESLAIERLQEQSQKMIPVLLCRVVSLTVRESAWRVAGGMSQLPWKFKKKQTIVK